MTTKTELLFNLLKAQVHLLELSEDAIAFDKALGEIDLTLYQLRSEVLRPTPSRDMSKSEMDKWLDNLEV